MQKILIKNIKGLVQAGEDIPLIRKGKDMQELPIVKNAFLYLEDNEVIAYGKMDDWKEIGSSSDIEIIDAEGCFVLPAFCDSHTHTVFAKTREEEFVDRIHGMSYEEIALKGGGILNSAAKLADMTEEELFNSAQERIQKMIACGTGAIEIKSGYGLSVESELKMLRVIKKLKAKNKIEIKATFLGAHAFPLAYKENHRGYIDLIIKELLPLIAKEKLAEYIDVFCEKNYFSVDEMAEIISAGKEYGLIPKVHVNQFTILGGVKKAVEMGALSVDHLEEIDQEDILALQNSNCMPTFLPGCSHFLGIPFGAARKIMAADLPLALASDFNPGSAPNYNLFTIWSLACIKMKMTPEEALNALTINSAYAMGLQGTHGKICLGSKAPIILTKAIPSLAYLPYSFGEVNVSRVFI
jgi:imidazolonepropionase